MDPVQNVVAETRGKANAPVAPVSSEGDEECPYIFEAETRGKPFIPVASVSSGGVDLGSGGTLGRCRAGQGSIDSQSSNVLVATIRWLFGEPLPSPNLSTGSANISSGTSRRPPVAPTAPVEVLLEAEGSGAGQLSGVGPR
ncbi:hypothetical protein FRC01_006567, partial [Tulasnella sp. 417]